MSSQVLVTGAAGFIGSHICRCLIHEGNRVTGLDDLSGGFRDHLPEGVQFVQGSVTDAALVQKLFAEHKFDYVFHLAAYAAEGLSHFIKHFNYTNNLLGSVNLINAAVNHEVKCFVFTSSIAVYGRNQLPMTEELVPQPEDPYGIAKYAVELDLREAHEMFGLNSVIFRPHNVYGENQNIGDRYRNVIGIFMNQVMQGQPMTIFGDGKQTRAFSYIDDVAPVIAASVVRPACYNQVFNVGADKPYSVLEVAQVVARPWAGSQASGTSTRAMKSSMPIPRTRRCKGTSATWSRMCRWKKAWPAWRPGPGRPEHARGKPLRTLKFVRTCPARGQPSNARIPEGPDLVYEHTGS
jgi:UDP-glucose 4-epimerase